MSALSENGSFAFCPRFLLSGDSALVVEFGNRISEEINRRVLRLAALVEREDFAAAHAVVEVVPTYRSLLIQYNPLRITHAALADAVLDLLNRLGEAVQRDFASADGTDFRCAATLRSAASLTPGLPADESAAAGENFDFSSECSVIEIPTLYGGEHGEDLAFVAEKTGLSPEEVVRIHAGRDYPVYMLGFMPGFPYLGGMDERIAVPRLDNPRTRIPGGSVGIAGGQTGIYPSDSPGGWRLIGRTPVRLYDPDADPPVSVSAGDWIRFVPVDSAAYRRIERLVSCGLYSLPKHALASPRRKYCPDAVPQEAEASSAPNTPQAAELAFATKTPGDPEASSAPNTPQAAEFPFETKMPRGPEPSSPQDLVLLSDGHVVPSSSEDAAAAPLRTAVPPTSSPRRIKVLQPGALTTVQDLGRRGYQKYGIPVAGAMDEHSMRLANILVGNREEEAVLEATYIGPELEFEQTTRFAVTGADLQPKLDDRPVPMYRPLLAHPGQTLSFGAPLSGVRAYLAFAGGVAVPLRSGSRATHMMSRTGGIAGRKLQREDIFEIGCPVDSCSCSGGNSPSAHAGAAPARQPDQSRSGRALPESPLPGGALSESALSESLLLKRSLPEGCLPVIERDALIHVVLGPQDDCFTEAGLAAFLSTEGYEITMQSDRMGMKLKGAKIEHCGAADIVSDATVFGSIQVPANGQPIVLMADRQTTGGYTKIATVITPDLSKLAQMGAGCRVRFVAIGIEEAQERCRAFYDRMQAAGDALRREKTRE